LSDEVLIETLKDSKNTAEIIAMKLKKISSTNQFLSKSRELYAPVAFRAAVLYFAVSDLYKINCMYQFSLTWFTNVFMTSLKLASMLQEKKEVVIEDEEYKLLNNKFTADERINILIKTFTQELYKKVIFSVYQEDRQLVTYFISMRILHAEGLADSELLSFALAGSKKVPAKVTSPGSKVGLPWITDSMWADLISLSQIKPFSNSNLIGHIEQNPEAWAPLYSMKRFSFNNLPNASRIDLAQFDIVDINELAKATELDLKFTSAKPSKGNNGSASEKKLQESGDTDELKE